MSKSPAFRFLTQVLPGSATAALVLCAFGLASPASAGEVTLCPSAATVGGFGGTANNVSGPLDSTCGANSAVQISLPASTDYGKLIFDASTPGYPAGLPLGGLISLSANVLFSSHGSDQPFFALPFVDASNSLGQASPTDQILLLEFQAHTLSGNTLAADPNSTLFNLYDNTTSVYLLGGQSDTNTIDGWLAGHPSLDTESLQGIWIGTGLTGGDSGPESLTVNSLDVVDTPEPASLTLLGVALTGLGFSRRRRRAR